MSRPTFTVHPDLFLIYVEGVPNPKGFPYVPDDMGLVSDLLEAIIQVKLPRPKQTVQSGGGVYMAFFHKKDADKIIEWLKTRADLVDEHPGAP